jgi:cyclic pyranopterin phosphate synthase
VVFNVMQANGRANTFFEQIFPRYTEIADTFRAFLRDVGEERPAAFLVDIPLCVTEGIPDFNRGFVEKYCHYDVAEQVVLRDVDREERAAGGAGKGLLKVLRSDLDDAERSKRAACSECRYDRVCEGVWGNYTRRYGWEEMRPIPA